MDRRASSRVCGLPLAAGPPPTTTERVEYYGFINSSPLGLVRRGRTAEQVVCLVPGSEPESRRKRWLH
jgi:hypothetical protein